MEVSGESVEQSSVLSEGETAAIVNGEAPEEVVLDSDIAEFVVPEKFQGKSIEDVIKSYQELEKFKGGDTESQEEKVTEEVAEETSTEPTEVEEAQYNKYAESYDKNGTLSEAEYAELAGEGYTKEQVDAEIANRNTQKEFEEYKAEKQLSSVLEPLGGGTDKFKEVATWANENKDPAEVKAFNEALSGAGKLAQQALLRGLYAEYDSAGTEMDTILHTNAPQRAPNKGYATQEEFFKDVGSPEYQNNAAYRAAVEKKMGQSNIF